MIKLPVFFWVFVAAVAAGLIYFLQDMLPPFVAGLIIAYLFAPVVDRMGTWGLGRRLSAILLIIAFLVAVIGAIAIIFPLLIQQAESFAASQPAMVAALQTSAADILSPDLKAQLTNLMQNHLSGAWDLTSSVVGKVAAGGTAAAQIIVTLILMPIVAYFMIKEWPHITTSFTEIWPRPSAARMQTILAEIDTRISGFVRGQLIVCLILATYYTIALWMVGIQNSLLIGLLGGLLSLVPFVGSIFVLGATALMGLFQIPDQGVGPLMWGIGAVVLGQLTEANFITPKIVGDRVGLHPLWIIFALMVGGHLVGFLGLLLAVPTAAALSVLIQHGFLWYKNSRYYTGTGKGPAAS